MKRHIVRLGLIALFALVATLFFERSVDVGYVMLFVVIYYCSFSIDGYLIKKDFYAGYIGTLEATDDNKNLRLFSFLLSIGLILLILVLLYCRYFLNFWP
ncbi:MAG: hypothetical protein JKY87_04405 [Mariprofundus sp.]|nr:hypothetical protein [Mariprofundus sp.]